MPTIHAQKRHSDTRVAEAISLIASNLRDHPSLKKIAARLGVCPETLRSEFRREVGKPISLFIRERQIETMKRALETSCLSCKELASLAGYKWLSNASRAFRRETGLGLAEYRS